ncbi:hypothetical protein AP064_01060 [Candidatus Liberibacter solanacearum]|nr:hypothetical protein AP064_01060 [Candidatus Liberibacter solanacearum]
MQMVKLARKLFNILACKGIVDNNLSGLFKVSKLSHVDKDDFENMIGITYAICLNLTLCTENLLMI